MPTFGMLRASGAGMLREALSQIERDPPHQSSRLEKQSQDRLGQLSQDRVTECNRLPSAFGHRLWPAARSPISFRSAAPLRMHTWRRSCGISLRRTVVSTHGLGGKRAVTSSHPVGLIIKQQRFGHEGTGHSLSCMTWNYLMRKRVETRDRKYEGRVLPVMRPNQGTSTHSDSVIALHRVPYRRGETKDEAKQR